MSSEDGFFTWTTDDLTYFGNVCPRNGEEQNGTLFVLQSGTNEYRLCYSGQLLNGKRNGFGINYYAYPNVYYSGYFVEDKRHGVGTMVFGNGAVYCGHFVEDTCTGRGSMLYEDGSFYYGYWFRSRREGNGRMTYSNGDVYEGQFHRDKVHGQGMYKTTTGIVVFGKWDRNRLVPSQYHVISVPEESTSTTGNGLFEPRNRERNNGDHS